MTLTNLEMNFCYSWYFGFVFPHFKYLMEFVNLLDTVFASKMKTFDLGLLNFTLKIVRRIELIRKKVHRPSIQFVVALYIYTDSSKE